MIREAKPEDCVALAALSIKIWLDTYAVDGMRNEYAKYVLSNFTEEYFIGLLSNVDYRLLVSACDGVLQGFVMVNLDSYFETRENGFEIEKLYVDEKFKGQGLGRTLLTEVAERFGNVFWLYTWVENESNEFYKHLGFRRIGGLTFDFKGHTIANHVYKRNQT
ncbi:GNAT family N-acetyltransferase [Desulforhopalus singaporensis]|uniref:Ribosomal protein S18 acetylase RimI n=1 Tax=Desulforhopalus singaporensis TaxID=91360 RepID=A0A1H0URS8_9BACT|nr:GNAT family N-acetyltransferase [Desulforhopalus singaporensis]SDP68922.1 Ribosomal protein S18 acetylase RimI [Desulforhopalus singaporensis]